VSSSTRAPAAVSTARFPREGSGSVQYSVPQAHDGAHMMEPMGKVQRISALDFTKGALVLFMVLYHFLNYFVSPRGDFYRYLRFVTPSFIFIAGFLISNVYLARYQVSDSRVPLRLVQRGVKILCIFVCLNVIISLLIQRSYNGAILFGRSLQNLEAIFATGNVEVAGVGKACAFYILVPISYLLLTSAGLLIVYRFYKYAFHIACAASLICVLLLDLMGSQSANLELVAIGLLGVIAGCLKIERINGLVEHPYALAGAYLCYALATTIWDAVYPLQIVGVCLTLMIIYLLGLRTDGSGGKWRATVVLLGRYSLYGYIAQIVVLQLLHRGVQHVDLGAAASGVALLAALVLTVASVELMERARARSPTVDAVYKGVFS